MDNDKHETWGEALAPLIPIVVFGLIMLVCFLASVLQRHHI